MTTTLAANPLAGFWMGGYEGADHINGSGVALDMADASGHLQQLQADHARAAAAGLRCVRESIGWRISERADGSFDLRRAQRIAESAARHGLQVLWTVMHYGLPADLSLHDDTLIARFARFAAEVARVVGNCSPTPPVYTPINEIGYLAWAASQPGLLAAPNNTPDGSDDSSVVSGYAIKRRLVRAALAGVQAMREVDARARFLHVEPVVHVVAPVDRPELAELAERVGSWQWQAWDLLAGHVEPALGGSAEALDMIGVNHYHSSQWEVATEARLLWHRRDPRWRPLSALLATTWQRYRRPLVVAETGHIGAGRADWLNDMASEVRSARAAGVPVEGLCVYPLLDRPDWNEPARWHRSGLWHVPGPAAAPAAGAAATEPAADGAAPRGAALQRVADAAVPPALRRTVDAPYLAALRSWQPALPGAHGGGPQRVLALFAAHRHGGQPARAAQLGSRLAGRWRVVCIDTARAGDSEVARIERIPQGPWFDVLMPILPRPVFDAGASARQPVLQALLQGWWQQQALAAPVAWVSSADASAVAAALRQRLLVFDAAAGDGGDSAVQAAADAVVSADAVPRSSGVQWLPDGVDVALFSAPVDGWDAHEALRLQGGIAEPRLGFAAGSVVDAAVDAQWLDAIAAARPDWQIVIVGALDGIAREALPQRPNLHWLGEHPGRLLPALMAGWRVGLLPPPARRTVASGGAQPLLQMLAAGLPVVAGRSPSDSLLGPPMVRGGPDAATAVRACVAALAETPAERQRRQAMASKAVAGRDWVDIAAEAHRLLLALDGADAGPSAATPARPQRASVAPYSVG